MEWAEPVALAQSKAKRALMQSDSSTGEVTGTLPGLDQYLIAQGGQDDVSSLTESVSSSTYLTLVDTTNPIPATSPDGTRGHFRMVPLALHPSMQHERCGFRINHTQF